jgi:DNA polymerase-3 subunit alpha
MVYQEQVMQIAQVLAGYSLGSADILRRAMSKKKADEMKKHSKIFIEGSANISGIAPETARKIFDTMSYFADYGFNKSHSAVYAYLAYQSAYLKTYYPIEFMTAVLTSEMNSQDKIKEYINCCQEADIKILQPDVNNSFVKFAVENEAIRFALCGIKGIGESAALSIVEGRKKAPYKNIHDFLEKIDLRLCNKAVLETLIKTGAFDSLKHQRKHLLDNLEDNIKVALNKQADLRSGQGSLFADDLNDLQVKTENEEEWSEEEKLQIEKEVLGFYLSANPLDKYYSFIKNNTTHNSRTLRLISLSNNSYTVKKDINIAGVIDKVKIFTREDQTSWARVTLLDKTGGFEITVNKNQFEQFGALLKNNRVVFIRCYARKNYQDEIQLIADNIEDIERVFKDSISEFHVFIKNNEALNEDLESFKNFLNTTEGSLSLFFHLQDQDNKEIILKAHDFKAPRDNEICRAMEETYPFIEKIKVL